LYRVNDVTLGEDQSTIHLGQRPTVMALLSAAAGAGTPAPRERAFRARYRAFTRAGV
jgi:hypothetical protein